MMPIDVTKFEVLKFTSRLLFIGIGSIIPLCFSPYSVSFIMSLYMYAILAITWNMLAGFTGYVSFGHVVFWGLGAYATAILIIKVGLPWNIAWLLSGVVGCGFAFAVGIPTLRLSGVYFAISMLALSEAVKVAVAYLRGVTGGGGGIYLPPLISLNTAYYLMWAVFATVYLTTCFLSRTSFGKFLLAVREDEIAAQSLGINTAVIRIQIFVLSSFFASLAGGLYVLNVCFIDPKTAFDISLTIKAILMTVLGGLGTLEGPIIGTLLLGGFSELMWARFPFIHKVLLGAAIMAIVALLPRGVVPSLKGLRWWGISSRSTLKGDK